MSSSSHGEDSKEWLRLGPWDRRKINPFEHVPIQVQDRVRAADPNQGRCLLENVPLQSGVELVYCFPKGEIKNKIRTSRIEWYWNLPAGSLNLISRYNVIPITSNLQKLRFNADHLITWILIPEERIVNQYHDSLRLHFDVLRASRDAFPIIEESEYIYRFLPIDDNIKDVVIRRHQDESEDLNNYAYPYDNLPLLKSHLHPKFAILEVGRALEQLCDQKLLDLNIFEKCPVLSRIIDVYGAWTRRLPPEAWYRFKSSAKRSKKSKRNSSDRLEQTDRSSTPPRQLESTYDDNRKKRRKGLSGKKLRQHDKKSGLRRWDSNAVESWSGEINRKTPDEQIVDVERPSR